MGAYSLGVWIYLSRSLSDAMQSVPSRTKCRPFLGLMDHDSLPVCIALPRQGCAFRYRVISIRVGGVCLTGTRFVVDEGTVLELQLHMSFTTCRDIVRVQGATWVLGLLGCLKCLSISSII